MSSPRFDEVRCLSPAGFHFMRWTEWGEADNPRLLVCVHGLTRVGRDFDLLARLNAKSVAWIGTSMGGLIGITLAGQPGSPLGRLLLNDVGPTLDAAALTRIGDYVGQPVRFNDLEQATDYVTAISKPFGLTSRAQWRAITETVVVRDGGGYRMHYDPRIAVPFKQFTPEAAAAGESALWALYDAIVVPTLLVRGENSDLLSRATAAQMTARGRCPGRCRSWIRSPAQFFHPAFSIPPRVDW